MQLVYLWIVISCGQLSAGRATNECVTCHCQKGTAVGDIVSLDTVVKCHYREIKGKCVCL